MDSLFAALDEDIITLLGETLMYAADGTSYESKLAHINYRDQLRDVMGHEAIEQDILVVMRVVDLPSLPPSAARITLPLRPGKTYQPINAHFDESGTHYEFELKTVVT